MCLRALPVLWPYLSLKINPFRNCVGNQSSCSLKPNQETFDPRVAPYLWPMYVKYIHRKPKRSQGRWLYYSNTCASQQLLLRGEDISTNPGPSKRAATKCEQCEKTIKKNQKAVSCGVCLGANHAKCAGVRNVLANMAWTCSGCLVSVLPFHKCCTVALIEDEEVITSYEFTKNSENIVQVFKEQ